MMKKEKKKFEISNHYYLAIIGISIAAAVICYFIGWLSAKEIFWEFEEEASAGFIGMIVASFALGVSITLNIMFFNDEL